MDKYVYNKNNGLWYELQEHRKVTYTALLTIGKLSNCPADGAISRRYVEE